MLIGFCFVFVFLLYPWFRAIIGTAPVKMVELVEMRRRRVPVSLILNSRIKGVKKAGLNFPTTQLMAHYLKGGRVEVVVDAVIDAQNASIPLTLEQACEIDLATKFSGKSFLEELAVSGFKSGLE